VGQTHSLSDSGYDSFKTIVMGQMWHDRWQAPISNGYVPALLACPCTTMNGPLDASNVRRTAQLRQRC